MPITIQAKILRLLQEKNIERLGGRETIAVDVRIIAATNRKLEDLIAAGKFREDLFYRLRVVAIELPPLREREGDTPLLCNYFLGKFSREMDIENPGLSEDAYEFVKNHPWPGNVRELANALQKALIFSRGYPIKAEDMVQAAGAGSTREAHEDAAPEEAIRRWLRQSLIAPSQKDLFSTLTDHFTGLLITEALNLTRGNRTQAAKLLGISRPTLHAKMDKLGLSGSAEHGSD
jgi:DNA-binding NtrC family response regulator